MNKLVVLMFLVLAGCTGLSSQLTTYDIPENCTAASTEMDVINKRLGRVNRARKVKNVVAGAVTVVTGVPVSSIAKRIKVPTETSLERLRFLGYYRMVHCG